ncbi:hypothetical protein [Agaribacterium sp. ZY112]|uniref:hypothetical protein n=1 Tax=Agaribacterium sp. ZY112 TaxID=3233574 RepID=UPI0035238003
MNKLQALFVAVTLSQAGTVSAEQVFYFPTKGQSPEQVTKETDECSTWAISQTGFDPKKAPSAQALAQENLAKNPAQEKSHDRAVLRGAARGAIVGSTVGRWNDNDRTTAGSVGAVAGAASASKGAQKQEAQQEQARQQQALQQAQATLDEQNNTFNRAMAACMDSKGYNIR